MDSIFERIHLSRSLDSDEQTEFENLHEILFIKTFPFNGRMIIMEDTDETHILNPWEISGISLYISDKSRLNFFIESLLYLIEYFFNPKKIVVSGSILGIDTIFDGYYAFRIFNNQVFYDEKMLDYLHKSTSIETKENLLNNIKYLIEQKLY